MKSKEELNALKEEVKAMNAKLAELTDDELFQVSGGIEAEGCRTETDYMRRRKQTDRGTIIEERRKREELNKPSLRNK